MKIRNTLRYSLLSLSIFSFPTLLPAISFEESLVRLLNASPVVAIDSLYACVEMAESASLANFTDPEIEAERLWAAGGGENKWNASLNWGFDWPGVYIARKNVAEKEKVVSDARFAVKKRGLLREMSEVLNRYIGALRRVELLERQMEATSRIEDLVEKLIGTGSTTILDESKIRIERARLKVALQEAWDDMKTADSELAMFAGEKAVVAVTQSGPEFADGNPMDLKNLEEAVAKSPDVLLSSLESEAARLRLSAAKSETLPGISLGYTHAYEEGTHFNGGRVGLSIPVFSSRGKTKTARLQAETAEMEYSRTKESRMELARKLYERLVSLHESLLELEQVFISSLPEESLRKSYELGRITLLEYLTERNYYLEAEMDYIRLCQSYSELYMQLRLI